MKPNTWCLRWIGWPSLWSSRRMLLRRGRRSFKVKAKSDGSGTRVFGLKQVLCIWQAKYYLQLRICWHVQKKPFVFTPALLQNACVFIASAHVMCKHRHRHTANHLPFSNYLRFSKPRCLFTIPSTRSSVLGERSVCCASICCVCSPLPLLPVPR